VHRCWPGSGLAAGPASRWRSPPSYLPGRGGPELAGDYGRSSNTRLGVAMTRAVSFSRSMSWWL
jgi:hypothetical protein